jgi:membrane complex biogenesis BtpA family protein
MKFTHLFPKTKPIIGCIHLAALPGAPLYDGNLEAIYNTALSDADILQRHGVQALIIENFRDKPFYPDQVPAETVAAMSSVAREIVKSVKIPVGINVLRNDGLAAMAIATAVGAAFVRVNVHMGAVVSDQGIIQGISHKLLRLKQALKSDVLIFADVGVKHAAPLAARGLALETKDLEQRGLVDAIIVSGELTGASTSLEDIRLVRANTSLPILIGSGTTPENIKLVHDKVDGFIVGTYFKKDGQSDNAIEEARVAHFMSGYR